ncbi:MAG TPA: DUF87 domain-containing protein [Aquifex aeolicus]|nr:DUF87 domain-containing protein [Aquifex aeolicus]
MSIQLLVSIVISTLGYVFLIRDAWKKIKQKLQNTENPKRNELTYGFFYFSGAIFLPLFSFATFIFFPIFSAILMVGMIFTSQAYFIYKTLKFFGSKIFKPVKTPYDIQPFSDEIKLTKDPEITVKAKAFSKHVHVLATTGAGKTKSVLAPIAKQFIEIGKGVMVIDPKGDNEVAKAFIELLKEQGRYPEDFWYFDIMKPKYSLSYNPLYSGIKYNKPQHMAVMIIATMPKVGGAATFYENLQKEFTRSITRLLSILPKTGKMVNFLDLYSIVAHLPHSIEYLLDKYDQELKDTKDELAYLWIKSIYEEAKRNREFKSYLRSLQQHLALYAFSFNPRLLNSYEPDIKIADGFREGKVMYFNLRALDFPSGESLDIGKMLLMDIQSYAAFKQRENIVSEIPDMVFIDEAHNVIVPEFQRMFEMARSAGIGIVLIHQSRQQFEEIKRGMFENIFNNTNIKIILRTEDPETRKYLAEYFGQTLRYFVNVSKGGENPFKKPIDAVLPHWSEIAMQRYDYKIRPEEFLELSPGEGFIAVGDRHILGVKGKLQYFAKEIKGKIDYDLIPVKDDTSWKDSEKGLCLLFEFAKDKKFQETLKEDVDHVKKLKEEISELSSRISNEPKKQFHKEDHTQFQELKDEEDISVMSLPGLDIVYDPTDDLNIK